MSKETLKNSLRTVRDFPIPGILFWDVTTLFKDAACLRELEDICDHVGLLHRGGIQLTQVVRGDDGRQTSVRYILGKQALYRLANDRIETVERLIAE